MAICAAAIVALVIGFALGLIVAIQMLPMCCRKRLDETTRRNASLEVDTHA